MPCAQRDAATHGTLVVVKAVVRACQTRERRSGRRPGASSSCQKPGLILRRRILPLLEARMPHRLSNRLLLCAAATVVCAAAPMSAQSFTTQKFNVGGDGGFDYLSTDPATGRVFISRGTHVMVVDGATGKVVGDIGDTPRTHGALIVAKENHGFTTNGGDSTSTMFDLKTLAPIKKIHLGADGADGFMYDDATNSAVTIHHSHPDGTAIVIDAKSGDVLHKVKLSANAPEGG